MYLHLVCGFNGKYNNLIGRTCHEKHCQRLNHSLNIDLINSQLKVINRRCVNVSIRRR